MEHGWFSAAGIDETWNYTPEQNEKIMVALGAAPDRQEEALEQILEATRWYRAHSVNEKDRPLPSEIAGVKKGQPTGQLAEIQGTAQRLYELLHGAHQPSYGALLRAAQGDPHGRILALEQELKWFRIVALRALDAQSTEGGRPRDEALRLYIQDLVGILDQYAPPGTRYSKPVVIHSDTGTGWQNKYPLTGRLPDFIQACTDGLVEWEGAGGAKNALKRHEEHRPKAKRD